MRLPRALSAGRRAALWVWSWLAVLAGCGGGGPQTIDHVVHLRPLLSDGRTPAAVWCEGPAPIETRFDLGGEGPWELVDTGERRVLHHPGPIEAAAFHRLELLAEGSGEEAFHATWKSDGAPRESRGSLRPTQKLATLAVDLGNVPGWRGEVRDLTLRFAPKSPFKIAGATLSSDRFMLGSEPSGAGDAGLVALGHRAHRAWPSALGVPLLARVEVPLGGRLSVRIAGLNDTRSRFGVSVREGSDWRLLAEAGASGTWVALEADLSERAGEEIELRFLAVEPGAELAAREGVPTAPEVLWGEPHVTGTRPNEARRPNVILITLDTTRGDVLGRGYTPNLDALAARGASFVRTFATTNSTVPSHASIMTGLALSEHGALGNRYAFGTDNLTWAERLRASGYHTSAAVSIGLLRPGHGFGQGFDRYELPHPTAPVDGAPAADATAAWLAERAEDDAPFFHWLHLFDPHTPYGPPAEHVEGLIAERGAEPPPRHVDEATMPVWDDPPAQLKFARGVSNLGWMRYEYELSVLYADRLVGRMLQALDEAGLTDNTLVVVTADHGESFGERDFWFEHGNLYPEVIHVPLILAGPGVPAGAVVEDDVSTVDLLPTVLRAIGRPDSKLTGVDLLPLARGDAAPERRLWFQLSDGRQTGFRDERVHFVATLVDGLRWISGSERNAEGRRVPRHVSEPAGTYHLFDLTSDPDATTDLGASDPRVPAAVADVEAWVASRAAAAAERRELSAGEEQQLVDLGYAGDE